MIKTRSSVILLSMLASSSAYAGGPSHYVEEGDPLLALAIILGVLAVGMIGLWFAAGGLHDTQPKKEK